VISTSLSLNDIVVGELYAKQHEPHNIGVVVLYLSNNYDVRILHSTGKIEMWDSWAFRNVYRRL